MFPDNEGTFFHEQSLIILHMYVINEIEKMILYYIF